MKRSRAALISLAVTLALTAVLSLLFGGKVFGLFLLLPLGFLFSRSRKDDRPPKSPDDKAEPIEPR